MAIVVLPTSLLLFFNNENNDAEQKILGGLMEVPFASMVFQCICIFLREAVCGGSAL